MLRQLGKIFSHVSRQWTSPEGNNLFNHIRYISATAIRSGKLEKAQQEEKEKKLILHSDEYFQQFSDQAKNQALFKSAVDCYLQKENTYRRGHVEFAYASIKRMKDFGSNKDLSSYKKILEVFPKFKMIPKNTWQAEMMHYPKQQQCAIDIMDEMERNGEFFNFKSPKDKYLLFFFSCCISFCSCKSDFNKILIWNFTIC